MVASNAALSRMMLRNDVPERGGMLGRSFDESSEPAKSVHRCTATARPTGTFRFCLGGARLYSN